MRSIKIRRPAILRFADTVALAWAPYHDDSAMMVADERSSNPRHWSISEGFSPRYRVSTSEYDPFAFPPTGIDGGEHYAMVLRWCEIAFTKDPNRELYLWDTQSGIHLNGEPHLIRKFTFMLSMNAPGAHEFNALAMPRSDSSD